MIKPVEKPAKNNYFPDIGYIYKVEFIEDTRERKFIVLPNGKPLYPTYEQLIKFTDEETAKVLWKNGTDYAYTPSIEYIEEDHDNNEDEDLEEWFN